MLNQKSVLVLLELSMCERFVNTTDKITQIKILRYFNHNSELLDLIQHAVLLRSVTSFFVRKRNQKAFKKYTTKRHVSEPVAFSCSEYLITTGKQTMSLPIGDVVGLTQSYTISFLRYLQSNEQFFRCSSLNKLKSKEVIKQTI